MREFFKGWRRKTGCATLLLASALLGLWLRGQFVWDLVSINEASKTEFNVVSARGGVYWGRLDHSDDFSSLLGNAIPSNAPRWQSDSYGGPMPFPAWISPDPAKWRWQCCGFDFGEYTDFLGTTTYWIVPYWALILPLTFLSAILILWPRKKQTAAAEQPQA